MPLPQQTSSTCIDAPQVLTPATPSTVNKPLAPLPACTNTPGISLNKTWILPPKPKPGRKPAVDTPPTKRKAQNREAQRAFRERRAAKVGELEDEMKKMEEEDAREQDALRDRICQLERHVQDLGELVEAWREKFNEEQIACGRERQLRQQAEVEVMQFRKLVSGETEAVPLPSRRKEDYQYMGEENVAETVKDKLDPQGTDTDHVPLTCGKCSIDTRCQCIEEAFEMSNIAEDPPESNYKRPHSPSSTTDNKRSRLNSGPDDNLEIDFTTKYSTRRPPTLATSTSTTSSSNLAIAPIDTCGFCHDGTPCLCAEMAKESTRKLEGKEVPSHQIAQGHVATTKKAETSNPCVNGPGTCAQCLSNPTSTLFCKSVAAVNNRSLAPVSVSTLDSSAPPRLTCADAFTTLSRHPAFSAATSELNSWVPQLTALPKSAAVSQRTAFDIEAASVMSVLKFFDRRFGEDGVKPGVQKT